MSIQIKVPKEHLLALIFWPTVSIFEISMSSSEILAKARHIINSKYKKVGACSSLSTTMSKPVNNHVQAGASSTMFKPVNMQNSYAFLRARIRSTLRLLYIINYLLTLLVRSALVKYRTFLP